MSLLSLSEELKDPPLINTGLQPGDPALCPIKKPFSTVSRSQVLD
jgi:hypothetical protein